MTVSTEVSREEYTGNGVTTDFDYRFRVFSAEDLVVSVADTTETITVLTLNTDYTVTGAGSRTGGKVKLLSPLAFNWRISIERALPVTQETDIRNQGNFFPEVHEDAFDKLTMLIQQVWGYFGLALRKPTWLAKYYDAQGNRIANLGNPINPQDAATKIYVDTAVAESDDYADDLFKRTLRVPESSVNQLPSAEVRAESLQGYNNLGQPVPIFAMTDTADLAIKLAGSFGTQLIGHTDLISKFYLLKDYLDQGYILVSSRDELLAAQNVIKTVMRKRTEVRLARDFAPWTASQTDIDLAWVTIKGHGEGTYIDATGIPNVAGNYFIRFYNSGELDIKSLPALEGLRFSGVNVVGPDRNSLVDGILFHSPEGQLGNLTVGYYSIQEFSRGQIYQRNAYIIKTVNAQILRCGVYHIDMPFGFSNYGENISFYGCTIATSGGVAVHINNGNGGITLTNCSIDYVGRIIISEAGYVEVNGGHHEFDNSINPLTGIPYAVSTAQTARITLRGTKVMCIRSGGMTQPYLVQAETLADGVYFFAVQPQNLKTTTGVLKTGDGRFIIRDSQVQRGGGNHGLTIVQSKYENLFIDPENSQPVVCDWYVYRVNSTVNSRTEGDNITITNSTDVHREGSHSLKVSRTILGTNHGVAVVAPVLTANQPAYIFYIYASGVTGSVFTDFYFVAVQGFDVYGRPNIVRQSDTIGTRTTLLTGATGWQSVFSNPLKAPAPAWATHVAIKINSSGISEGYYYIADAGVWQI